MQPDDLIKKSQDGESLTKAERIEMLGYPPDSADTYRVMAEAGRIFRELTDNKAEVHAQFALDLAPCARHCLFCSFAETNGMFRQETRITPEEAVASARQLEAEGANAVFMMTTAHYPFGHYLEISWEVRRNLKPETMLIANIGDQSLKNALRLREGTDTTIPPERRRESIRNFQEAGLKVGTCVEPLGPEHTNEEIADMILYTGSFDPAYSGAARRIPIPGTEMARRSGRAFPVKNEQITCVWPNASG